MVVQRNVWTVVGSCCWALQGMVVKQKSLLTMFNGAGKRRTAPWNDDPRSWYQLEVWRRRRRRHLMQHPVCVMCASNGLAVAATVADHIKPHCGNWIAFLTEPLQSLCKPCHDSDKRFVDLNGYQRIAIGADGWPLLVDDKQWTVTR